MRRAVRPEATWRLICLPHAGASSGTFSHWSTFLTDAELIAVQLPGRGDRLREPLPDDFGAVVNEVHEALSPYSDLPLVVFGHCGGAVLALEVVRRLTAGDGAPPTALVVSGQAVPTAIPAEEQLHRLSDDELAGQLRRLGGLPLMLDNPQLLRLVLPVVRADMRLTETIVGVAQPVCTPILAVRGTADVRVSAEELANWRTMTTGAFSVREFPGGHFYFEDDAESLVQEIAEARPVA
ncbi:thioesterase II family protein [Virgisporangium aliadipatigenens]|uniref:thioesterase II family protein n=1 Tax=Virgisporangium aliadipatigenens TaxID=741659 RepID=UPI001944D8B9|nr:alpha/beta fold hydrolase [Virgisporangium aliadipatigenens]